MEFKVRKSDFRIPIERVIVKHGSYTIYLSQEVIDAQYTMEEIFYYGIFGNVTCLEISNIDTIIKNISEYKDK
jgi:hypothetical protein